MQFRQKQPPHMPILEKRGSVDVSCSSHEKNLLPSFSSILRPVKMPRKARYRARATLRRAHPVPPPHVASSRPHRAATRSVTRVHIREVLQGQECSEATA